MGFHEDMAAGYGFAVPAIRLGRPFQDPAKPDTDVEVGIPIGLLNRHGLIGMPTSTSVSGFAGSWNGRPSRIAGTANP